MASWETGDTPVSYEAFFYTESYWSTHGRLSKHKPGVKKVNALIDNGREITEVLEACDAFSSHFKFVYQSFQEVAQLTLQFERACPFNSSVFSTQDVLSAIDGFNGTSAIGYDSIAAFMIKVIKCIIAPVLSSIFSWSLASGCFCSFWKKHF